MPNLVNAPTVEIVDTTPNQTLKIIGRDGEDDGEIILKGHVDRLGFNIGTSGGSVIAFNQFTVEVQMVNGGPWFTMVLAWGTAVEDEFLLNSPTVLETLAHGTNGVSILGVGGIWAVRFSSAQAAATAVAVTRTLQVCRGRSS